MSCNLLTIDLETYYHSKDYTLKGKMCVPEYVHDPRFHIHGVALRHPDGRCEFAKDVPAALAALQEQYGRNLERVTVVMHNAHFDSYVLAKKFDIHLPYVLDILQIAAAIFGRKSQGETGGERLGLKDLAQHLGLPAKGKLDFMSGVRDPDVRQWAALTAYAINDAQLTYAIAVKLLPRLSRPKVELSIAMHTQQLHNERGVPVDVAAIPPLIAAVQAESDRWFQQAGVTPEEVGKSALFTPLLEKALARTGRKVPLKDGKKGKIPATAKTDPDMQALCDDSDPIVATLANARLAKGQAHQLVTKLQKLARITTATGGILPAHLVYYGAHTGRFSGGGGFNIQNLPKGDIGNQVRALFTASPDHRLIVLDLAQIEARILAALAWERRLLDAFRNDIDIYCAEASAVFGQLVRKPTADDTPEQAALLRGMRETGKQEVLGLGFGMGALKFMNTLRKNSTCAALFNRGVLTPLRCVETVKRFRQEFAEIPVFWKAINQTFQTSAQLGTTCTCYGITVETQGTDTEIILPSSRRLRYSNVRFIESTGETTFLNDLGELEQRENSGLSMVYGPGDGTHLYGGKLTENIVQAMARDILVEAILRVEARGVRVLWHVHDEVIAMAPTERAEADYAILKEELTREPAWMPGVPLKADGDVMERYGKP